jgi:hypothetical protein
MNTICTMLLTVFAVMTVVLPAQAAQSEDQRQIIRRATEAKQERARQALEQRKLEAEECLRPTVDRAETGQDAG